MLLINVQAFLERERLIGERKQVDRRPKVLQWRNRERKGVELPTKVFEFCDDETSTAYAILSHRWIETPEGETTEVNYDEMIGLARMEKVEQDEVRRRLGYQKILDSCKQAKKDGYKRLWVDTCCIDKRSSAELSEAINSMYRWYENSGVCYVYLHDVSGASSFPTARDQSTYPNGWPEWFSRGWTLQEMIAPNNVQFFNKDWKSLGDKSKLADALACITRVPKHILRDGLSSNRPCVAQIMSWAADRKTSRVEDRAYSLLGLLNVNMPMLYGEGRKAFHRLQLEIIRTSEDQSIFAWGHGGRTGSILADDPSFFRNCGDLELMDLKQFIQSLHRIPNSTLPEAVPASFKDDRFGTFQITNRGIQIWMLFTPSVGSSSVLQAWLPCYSRPLGTPVPPVPAPVPIELVSWQSNCYRYFSPVGAPFSTERTIECRQLCLRYQDMPHRDATFEIDDSGITETENGFTYCGTFPSELGGSTFKPTSADPLCIKVYSDDNDNRRFAVGVGQCFGHDWIHFVVEKSPGGCPWEEYARAEYHNMLVSGPEIGQFIAKARSRGECYGRLWLKYSRLSGSAYTVRTSCVVWDSPKSCGIKFEVFRNHDLYNPLKEWKCFDVAVGGLILS